MSSREYRTVFVTIWTDPDFRNLSIPAQRLYFLMLTHPTLSPCGVIEWREPKLAAYAGTGDVMDLRKAAYELGTAGFIAVDPDTEEALVRSYVRHDGTLKSPNMARGLVKAYGDVASQRLMAIISKEVRRAVAEHPEWKGVGSVGEVTKQFPDAESETFEMVPGWFDPTQPNPSERVRSGFDLGSISVRSELPPSGGEPFDLSSPNQNQNQNQNPSSNEEDTSATCVAAPPTRRVTYPPAFQAFRDDVERVCRHMADSVEARGAKRPTITKAWRDAARLLLDKDGHTEADAIAAIDWSANNQFWQSVILTPKALRKHYDQMLIQSRQPQRRTQADLLHDMVQRNTPPNPDTSPVALIERQAS